MSLKHFLKNKKICKIHLQLKDYFQLILLKILKEKYHLLPKIQQRKYHLKRVFFIESFKHMNLGYNKVTTVFAVQFLIQAIKQSRTEICMCVFLSFHFFCYCFQQLLLSTGHSYLSFCAEVLMGCEHHFRVNFLK